MPRHLWHKLEDLLRICASELDLPIDFSARALEGSVRIDSGPGVSVEGLWATANRVLASGGLACIQVPGEDTLSIVPLDQAAGLARLENGDVADARAGYIKVLRPIRGDAPSDTVQAIQTFLPKGGTLVASPSGTDHVLIAGLKFQVIEALSVLELLDRIPSATVTEEIELRRASPIALAALLEQVVQKRKAVDGIGLKGATVAAPGSPRLVIVAPEEEMNEWRELVLRFDRAEATFTKHYVPRRFGLAETVELVSQVVGVEAGGGPRIVQDMLTGSLIVTAPLHVHEEIQQLLDRLERTDLPPRKGMRSFPIEHRNAEDLVKLLESLIGDGDIPQPVLGAVGDEGTDAPGEVATPAAPSVRAAPGDSPGLLTLTADEGTNRILAFGDLRLLDELEALIRTVDVLAPQVLVEVLVVSLTDSQMLDLGVELRAGGESDGREGRIASLFGLGAPELDATAIPALAGTGGTGVILNPGDFSALVRALETVNKGRTLTVPKVLVSNHEDANLNSVLQTPYTTTAATTTVATTSFGGSSDAGTSITVTPHIQSGDQLRLDYSVSISSFVGDSVDPALPPPRQENLLDSTVTVPDGHTIVVGGLEVDSETEAVSRLPLLGRLPILGALFRNTSAGHSKSRFFVFLRCSVLQHERFEDLKYLSVDDLDAALIDDGLPVLEPRIMR
ncbi:MAG: hypothetical protein GY725_26055 [bacterium]|nr:hypothetical protein [bacterium]